MLSFLTRNLFIFLKKPNILSLLNHLELIIIYTLQTTLDFEKGENLAAKLFQLYEFCRQQLIKCFREQVVEGVKKAMNALEEIFVINNMRNNER